MKSQKSAPAPKIQPAADSGPVYDPVQNRQPTSRRARRPKLETLTDNYSGPFATQSEDRDEPGRYGLWVPTELLDEPMDEVEFDGDMWIVVPLANWNKGKPRMKKVIVYADSDSCPKHEAEFGINDGVECCYVTPDEWSTVLGRAVDVPQSVADAMAADK